MHFSFFCRAGVRPPHVWYRRAFCTGSFFAESRSGVAFGFRQAAQEYAKRAMQELRRCCEGNADRKHNTSALRRRGQPVASKATHALPRCTHCSYVCLAAFTRTLVSLASSEAELHVAENVRRHSDEVDRAVRSLYSCGMGDYSTQRFCFHLSGMHRICVRDDILVLCAYM